MASSPGGKYFYDGNGLRPRPALFWIAPKQYVWLRSPRWFVTLMCRYWDWRGGH
jgi:hypothetical protein